MADSVLRGWASVSARRAAEAVLSMLTLVAANSAFGATVHLYPTQSFEQAVESLAPGDTLIVHAGDYYDSGRISITLKGTAAQPVVIRAAQGEARPHIRREAAAVAQNTINVEGATYLTIAGLEISSNGGDGINLNSNPSYITLEDLKIHDVDVGVNLRSSMNNITVRRSEIYRTGAPGDGTGEGMYVGCNYAECVVRDSVIENNWIHATKQSSQGDGIEIKLGSYGNLVRNNVIHDTGYPCILTYGTNGNPVNVVEGNVMWNCGDSGIQTAAEAIIRNNIIFGGTSNSFNSQTHQGAVPRDLQFVHNTIVGGQPCVRLAGWGGQPALVFANNAVYCEGGGFAVGDLTGVIVSGNVINPATAAFPSGSYLTGRSAAADLTDPVGRNVYPAAGSTLIDVATSAYATGTDFNGSARTSAPEAGAYEWVGANNPGWTVVAGFKNVTPPAPLPPQVTLQANPSSVAFQGSATLTWSSTNAVSCSASGAWSGNKALNGSESTGALTTSGSYTLTCLNAAGQSAAATASITVAAGPTAAGPPSSLAVPTADTDGTYLVGWAASATAGVTYVLQEATNASFSVGLRTAYSGTALTAAISGRSNGVTYYYRVKATLSGYADSAWVNGANGCAVTIPPASAVTLTPSIASPATIGTTVTFTAIASGGTGSYEYMYLLQAPRGTLNVVRNYSTTANWNWNTIGLPTGTYQVEVRTRNVGSTASYEAYRSLNCKLAKPPRRP